LLAAARAQLASEFDKHAGRARWDLAQRLEAVRHRFQTAMRAELEEAVEAIVRAASHADELRRATVEARAHQTEADSEALRLAARASSLR
jgi:hypothetical protein